MGDKAATRDARWGPVRDFNVGRQTTIKGSEVPLATVESREEALDMSGSIGGSSEAKLAKDVYRMALQ